MEMTFFSKTDLLHFAGLILDGLRTDQADFQAFDAVRFTNDYLTDFEAARLAYMNAEDDETYTDRQTQRTAELDVLVKGARKAYRDLKYFVEKAFPDERADSTARRNEFGFDDYKKVRRSASGLIPFFSKLYAVATDYQTDLIDAGFTQDRIDDLQTLRQQLDAKLIERDRMKNRRPEETANRNALRAALEGFVSDTCKAGKLIYMYDNEAKYRQYLLPKRGNRVEIPEQTVAPNAKTVLETQAAITEDTTIEIENTGDAPVSIYVAADASADAPADAIVVAPNTKVLFEADDVSVNDMYNALIAVNNTAQTGRLTVELLE